MQRQPIAEAVREDIVNGKELVFVDFDHTLLACNSSELFIAACKPSWLVACIDLVVRRLIPWKLTHVPHWYRLRDYACCALIVLLCPWNVMLWKRGAPDLFRRHESRELAVSLRACDPTRLVIVSFGLQWIIRALLSESSWRDTPLVATPNLAGPAYFSSGKLDIVRAHYPDEVIARAACISDSLDDQDILHAVGKGVLIEPQGDVYRAEEHLYLPLRYTAAAKYARSYVLDQFLFVDVLIVIAATSFGFSTLWQACLFVPPLMLSLMCVYELGYFENDMVAARKEVAPTLTAKVERYRTYPIGFGAWAWALVLGLLGVLLGWHFGALRSETLLVSAACWLAVLAVVRAVFFAYNGTATRWRAFFYPVLQLLKYGSPFVLILASLPGAVLVLSQIMLMWCSYLIYRAGGNNKAFNRDVLRLMMFGLGGVCLAASFRSAPVEGFFPYAITAAWACARVFKAPIMRACKTLRSRPARRSETAL
ncbi:hypothetical protein GCM10007874_02270 [Labrys miyagiensis]|uniref:Haloacid dehalogenase-like hydrolase n=1 Tax=Labrys miyagiensis TaxID=346912 RepID=A0ABQ6CC30_9HYPH|nr:hypothetical protein [Labrys miyagiensis]GLS17212.1 hypothetical protein GCM10007874_02270 [Labrys miyagiensis]